MFFFHRLLLLIDNDKLPASLILYIQSGLTFLDNKLLSSWLSCLLQETTLTDQGYSYDTFQVMKTFPQTSW